jgi:hypothetical protein
LLKIREKQAERLRAGVLQNFRIAMAEHLTQFAPDRVSAAGPEGVAAFVAKGIDAAREEGLRQRGPVRMWLEIMCVLGHGFNTDPQYRGLRPDLDPETFPMPFAQRLHRNVLEYIQQCFGPDRMYLARAVSRALDTASWVRGSSARGLINAVEALWPEKLAVTGTEPIAELSAAMDSEAQRIGLVSAEGRSLMGVLGVCFGAGILNDPLYPWLHARLTADKPENERIERTRSALKIYAEQAAQGLVA